MRLGSQARGRAHPWLRVTLNLGVAGALLYSLREVLKRRTNVRARKNSIRAAGDRILQLPRPATTDAETSVGAATSPASDSVNDQAAQNILVRGLIHSEAQAGLATNNWTRILFPGWDVFLFVTLFVGAMLLALVIMPKPASVERLPLEAPAVESDAEDQQGRPLYLSNLKLYESHGGVNLQPAEKRFLDKSNDIFIEIAGRLKSEVTSPGKVRVSIDLPKYAGVVARCANRFETEFSPADCHIEDRSLVISGAVTPQSDGFVVVARVIGIPGVWLSATSAHADARLPLIYDQHRNMGSAEQSAFPVSIQFDIPEAPKWSWSGDLPKVGPTYVSWDYTVDAKSSISSDRKPSPISGVRDDVVDANTNKVFIAGVLLGVAGGSLLAAFQSGVAVIQRTQDQRRTARKARS